MHVRVVIPLVPLGHDHVLPPREDALAFDPHLNAQLDRVVLVERWRDGPRDCAHHVPYHARVRHEQMVALDEGEAVRGREHVSRERDAGW